MDARFTSIRHVYAKNQPWNADESLVLLGYSFPGVLLDGRTYTFLKTIRQPSQALWSNVDPAMLIGTAWKAPHLVAYDVHSEKTRTVASFPEYMEIDLGGGEGNLSNDDRRIALFGRGGRGWELFAYDLNSRRVLARRAVKGKQVGGTGEIDNATMSPSGRYVILAYSTPGEDESAGVFLLDENLRQLRRLSKRGGSHFDVCLDAHGDEVWLGTHDESSALVAIRLRDGNEQVVSRDVGYNIHISCRSVAAPGIAVISEYYARGDERVTKMRRVGLASLDPGRSSLSWIASTESSPTEEYERMPMAVGSRTARKIMWASDWGTPSQAALAYVLTIVE